MLRNISIAVIVLPLLVSPPVVAELTNNPLLGAGVEIQPAYDGSRNDIAYPVPLIRYLGQRWFIRDTQDILEGGFRYALLPGLYLGGQLAYEPGRLTYQSNLLQRYQIPGIAPSLSWGAHLEWDTHLGPAPINILLRDRQRTDRINGNLFDARISVGILDYHHLGLALFTQNTWANQTYNRGFYGVSSLSANQTGLTPYQPGSGLVFNTLGIMGGYSFNSHWGVFGSLEHRRFSALVKDSPIVDAGSARYINLSLIYQFP
ncbi:MltA-interacting protein precursor [Ferrovum sp. JA12]|uniref:MipA/OmpV family protein n=1 Tax=Ferrovum sp. JA12 TaxID=1356299 RepID=UPI0007025AE4|nr:MipA/OmpV family protein [Ferrovum sp. JA12]KRH78349.1 MltA-interacting protein precursor [Ferrovum sp. JA12]